MTIGERIRKRRNELGLSADKIAEIIGKNRATIYRYESDEIENFSPSILEPLAKALQTTPGYLMGWESEEKAIEIMNTAPGMVLIPIFGSVQAGYPLEAIEDIDGEVAIPAEWIKASKHEYFALRVKGDSMRPKYLNGDVVVIHVQPDCENGQDCIVFVNGEDATFKKVIKGDKYITLQPYNAEYEPRTFVGREMNDIRILGVVKQLIRNMMP